MTYLPAEQAFTVALLFAAVAFLAGLLLGIRCHPCRRLRGKKPPKPRRTDLFD